MNDVNYKQRAKREKDKFNEGLDRSRINALLKYCDESPSVNRMREVIRKEMIALEGKTVLELGSATWIDWVDKDHLPSKIVCVNISEVELEKGVSESIKRGLSNIIEFRIMDANKLNYEDNEFDFVFGSGILHHLDLKMSLSGIKRVLKPGGKAMFLEPLYSNPVSIIARKLTPEARTIDERPISYSDLQFVKTLFLTKNKYYQFVIVPICIFSKILGGRYGDYFLKIADTIDRKIEAYFPIVSPMFRHVLLRLEKP